MRERERGERERERERETAEFLQMLMMSKMPYFFVNSVSESEFTVY